MDSFEILSWDSDFFKFKVAKITLQSISGDNIETILSALKHRNVRLAYWQSEKNWLDVTRRDIKEVGGLLVDLKTTYTKSIESAVGKDFGTTGIVEPYDSYTVTSNMRDIAIQSGEYSRFAIDPNIPKKKFNALYSIWIDRSVRKEIADDVLVIREHDEIIGLVTLKKEDKRGNIGLIAVERLHRGRKQGENLLGAAIMWFAKHDCTSATVATQGANVAANNLYQKFGFYIESVRFYYHFWL